jgi:putative methanogenesis marker protein 8
MAHKDEHIIEAIGKARVVVRDGKVVEVGLPLIEECPLAARFSSPVTHATPEAIGRNIQDRIDKFGMCSPERALSIDRDFVFFGASELIAGGISSGLLDSAVIACDGAGTVIAFSPLMVQGIGGRMSGLVKTSPIDAVISRIRDGGGIVVDPETAAIDQVGGTAAAHAHGCVKVAVTVTCAEDAAAIRARFPGTVIIGVHLTGVSAEDAAILAETCDILSSCASRQIRKIAGPRALLQGGVSIPVFAMTPAGKELIIEKIRRSSQQVVVKGSTLPYAGVREPRPLI